MGPYLLRRGAGMLVSCVLVITITFLLMELIPGDPAAVLLGPDATPEQVDALRASWGLDRPGIVRYGFYIRNILRGELGRSVFLDQPVLKMIGERAETSLLLGLLSLLVVVGLGVSAGITAALRPRTWTDSALLFVALLGASLPSFWLGLMLMIAFAGELHWFPSSGFSSIFGAGGLANLRNLVLPALSLGFVNAALVARTSRSSMLDVLQAEYVTTARAKGLAENVVIAKHALRNAAIPILTVVSFTFASLVSGAVVTENVFALPGVGSLIVQSVLKRDYPTIQGVMLAVAIFYVLVNFATDMLYAFLDPRIRYR